MAARPTSAPAPGPNSTAASTIGMNETVNSRAVEIRMARPSATSAITHRIPTAFQFPSPCAWSDAASATPAPQVNAAAKRPTGVETYARE